MTAVPLGSALENKVSSLQAEFRSVRDTLQGYKEQNEKQAKEIEALRARTSALEEENSKLQNANKNLEDKFSALQKGLADSFEKSKSKSSKAASVDVKLASMQTVVTELRSSLDSSKTELQDGIETLKREQENLKTNAKDLKNGLERLEKEMAAVKEKDETNVQQMSEAIQRLGSQISKVDTPVAFYAVLNKTLTTRRSETLALDGLVSNVGKGYNATTGVFTAPVRGTYIFMATSGPNQDRGKTSLAMMMEKANQGRPRLISYLFAFDFAMSTCHASQELEEGDKVWLESYAEDEEENTFSGHRWTTFTGMLVQPRLGDQ